MRLLAQVHDRLEPSKFDHCQGVEPLGIDMATCQVDDRWQVKMLKMEVRLLSCHPDSSLLCSTQTTCHPAAWLLCGDAPAGRSNA